MSHIPKVKRICPVGFVCNATATNSMGFFYSMKESIVIYRSFYEAIKDLTKEQQADAWNAIFEYGLNQQEIEMNGVISVVFKLVKPQLDANLKRYENGVKGGRPKNQTITKQEPNNNLTETKVEPNVNVNVNVNDNVNVKRFIKPTQQEVKEYMLQQSMQDESERFYNYYEANGWKVGKNPMKNWKAAVITWKKNTNEVQTNKYTKFTF